MDNNLVIANAIKTTFDILNKTNEIKNSKKFISLIDDIIPEFYNERNMFHRILNDEILSCFASVIYDNTLNIDDELLKIYNKITKNYGVSHDWAYRFIGYFCVAYGWKNTNNINGNLSDFTDKNLHYYDNNIIPNNNINSYIKSDKVSNKNLSIYALVVVIITILSVLFVIFIPNYKNNEPNSIVNENIISENIEQTELETENILSIDKFVTESVVQTHDTDIYPSDTSCQQFILAKTNGSKAILEYYEKNSGYWNYIFNIEAYIGSNGLSYNKMEGDSCTPAGEYDLPFCFGYDTPYTNLKFMEVNASAVWVYDSNSNYYNTLQFSDSSSWSKQEYLSGYFGNYDYSTLIYVAYNGDGLTAGSAVPNKGSMITICGVNGELGDTCGCIDISSQNMYKLLSYLDSSKNPKIIIQ